MILDLAMPVTAVKQSFHNDLSSEAITIFSDDCSRDLPYLMEYLTDIDPRTEKEPVVNINNILAATRLYGNGIAKELNVTRSFAPPPLITETTAANSLKQRNFTIHLIIMMAEYELESLRRSLDSHPGSI